jgi:SAM-dependent methyltransferase
MRIVHPSMTRRDVARSVAAAALVEHPLRFVRYETVSLAGPRAITYRLTGRGVSAVIRHGSRDIDRMLEVFARGLYALPEPLRETLGRGQPRILDLGAGPGLTSLGLLAQYPDATVVSVEPDPINALILRRTMAANPRFDRWSEVVGAVGAGEYLRGPGYGRLGPAVTDDARREQAGPVDGFELLGQADLAVLNIQGAEWRLLGDPRFADSAPPALILEAHRRGAPSADPVQAAGRTLSDLGYRLITRRKGRAGNAVLLGWRADTRR